KRYYDDSNVLSNATYKEVDELIESGCDVIAMDATANPRPRETLEELVSYVRNNAPHLELMADISTVEEAKNAEKLNFDYIGTTLHGYTNNTKGNKLYDNDFSFLKDIINAVQKPVIAEGNIMT